MADFAVYSETDAPEGARDRLAGAKKSLGFVPNLFGTFAEAPVALEAYQTLGGIFDKSSFTATERQIVRLSSSFVNECHYCMAAEAAVSNLQKVDADIVAALREGRPLADPKLETLRRFTAQVTERRGWVSDEDVQAFLNAGYTRANVLEVIVGVAQKVLSNYTNHIAKTPLDEPFKPLAWTKPATQPA